MPRQYYVYILTNRTRSTLYIGMTGNLSRRMEQHRSGSVEGFSKRYHTNRLVYVEQHTNPRDALLREKQLKNWQRAWKDELIESMNPTWRDLIGDMSSP